MNEEINKDLLINLPQISSYGRFYSTIKNKIMVYACIDQTGTYTDEKGKKTKFKKGDYFIANEYPPFDSTIKLISKEEFEKYCYIIKENKIKGEDNGAS